MVLARADRTRGDGAEPALHTFAHLLRADVAADGEHGVVRRIVGEEKLSDISIGHFLDVRGLLADGREAVGVRCVDQSAQIVVEIAVWAVEMGFLELFDHHAALHFERLWREGQAEHTVAFEPEKCFEIAGRGHVIEVCEVIRGPCVVHAAGAFHLGIEIGDVDRASEHEVFEQVGQAGHRGVFVAGTYVVENVDGNHCRRGIIVVDDPQSVRECEFMAVDHFFAEIWTSKL